MTKNTNATSKQNAFMENVTVKETLLGMDDSAEVRILNILKWFTTDVNLDLHNSMGWKLTKKQLFVEEGCAATIPREKPCEMGGVGRDVRSLI